MRTWEIWMDAGGAGCTLHQDEGGHWVVTTEGPDGDEQVRTYRSRTGAEAALRAAGYEHHDTWTEEGD